MKNLCILPFLFLLIACENTLQEPPSLLVVEGWIEHGGYPVVMLTNTVSVTEENNHIEDLYQYLVRWATVTVSDGEKTVTLTGKYDSGYFPPYIYTTGELCGEAGKEYTLTVRFQDYTATAVTTIPEPVGMDTYVEQCIGSDTLYQVSVGFRDPPSTKDYYKLFTRVGSQKRQFQSAYLGIFTDEVTDGYTRYPVYRGQTMDKTEKYIPYFSINDTVSVKLAHIDEASYHFWSDYENLLSFSSNQFFPVTRNIRGNVQGGLGYWCGYGATTHHLIIKSYVK